MEVKKAEQLNSALSNLYLIVDTYEVKDNLPEDLQRALRYAPVLKTQEREQDDLIAFYNFSYAQDLQLDQKIVRWKHLHQNNEGQQLALSFNDEVALFKAFEIMCAFKGIEYEQKFPDPSEGSLDTILADL